MSEAVEAHAEFLQYRAKSLSSREMLLEATAFRQLCSKTCFLINNRLGVALAIDANGVHLGQDDLPLEVARNLLGPRGIIGITVHNLEVALIAERGGADYLGVSPTFTTQTKPNAGKAAGLEMVERFQESVHIPVVAIGGINLQNAVEAILAGADAICAISQVVTTPDVRAAIAQFQHPFEIP